jgi:hypothetical protein
MYSLTQHISASTGKKAGHEISRKNLLPAAGSLYNVKKDMINKYDEKIKEEDFEGPCKDVNMKAALNLPKRGSAAAYDVVALGTMRCRHAAAYSLVDIDTSERFCHCQASLRVLVDEGFKIERLWYDVGCERFILNTTRKDAELLSGIQCMLPAMHAQMHSACCRVVHAGDYHKGAGWPRSELNEPENAALLPIGLTTQSMGPMRRRETIEGFEIIRNRQRNRKMTELLMRMMAKALALGRIDFFHVAEERGYCVCGRGGGRGCVRA